MRLIDADALIDELTQRCCNNCIKRMGTKNGKRKMVYEIGDAPCLACEVDDIKVELDETPTIDAEPVRHGKWIWDDEGYHCSECWYHAQGNTMECIDGTFRFCPVCGARMEENEE